MGVASSVTARGSSSSAGCGSGPPAWPRCWARAATGGSAAATAQAHSRHAVMGPGGRRMPACHESAGTASGCRAPSRAPRPTHHWKAWSESIPRKRFDWTLRPAGYGVNSLRRGEGGADARVKASPYRPARSQPASHHLGLAAASLFTCMMAGHQAIRAWPSDPPTPPTAPRGGRARRHLPAARADLLERADRSRAAKSASRIDSATRFDAGASHP